MTQYFWQYGVCVCVYIYIYIYIYIYCHGTTCIISRIKHLHPFTITRVLITNTCNHLPPPFISSLPSVTHQLVSRLHGSQHRSMSACLPVHPGTRPYLWKRKFTYSDTVHPASSALFIISLMLEALPELRWINYLLIRNYLSVSLTSMWQKTSS